MSNSDGSKGSSPRPFSISLDKYAHNWDVIFKKDKETDLLVSSKEDLHSNEEMQKNPAIDK